MTTQTGSIDLSGRATLRVALNLDAPTKRAVARLLVEKHAKARAAQGLEPDPDFVPDVPPRIWLRLREASFREQRDWDLDRQSKGAADPVLWTAELLRDRCEDDDIDIDVLHEMVMGMDGATMAQFQQAFITGTLQDPKVMRGASTNVTAKLTAALLLQLAQSEVLPFSPGTSASDPGNANG